MIHVATFLLAFAADYLTLRWHQAREGGAVWRTSLLSMLLEAISWIPVLALVLLQDWTIAIVLIIASGCGTAAGLRRVAREQSDSVVGAAPYPTRCPPSF